MSFKAKDKVQCVRSTSEFYGQIGVVDSLSTGHSDGTRYTVTWPNGTSHVYRASSLTAALLPEKIFQESDTGFRKQAGGGGVRKITKHRVPSSNRPVLA